MTQKKVRHLLSPRDLSPNEIKSIIKKARAFKKERLSVKQKKSSLILSNKMIGLLFQKSSTRTRISFEVGIRELGGESFFFDSKTMQIGRGESITDTLKVLERYLHGLIIRNNSHQELIEISKHSTIPLINGLSDWHHPCQVLADVMTIEEVFSTSSTKVPKLAYIGDGNNTVISLIEICSLLKWPLIVTTPKDYACPKAILKNCFVDPQWISFNHDPSKSVKGCQVVYTDTWFSMGQEAKQKNKKMKAFQGYQVNDKLLKDADKNYIFLHCLPAYRGLEVSDKVIDGEHSKVFDQAENRLHVQKAILDFLF